eukprot:gene616-11941_t
MKGDGDNWLMNPDSPSARLAKPDSPTRLTNTNSPTRLANPEPPTRLMDPDSELGDLQTADAASPQSCSSATSANMKSVEVAPSETILQRTHKDINVTADTDNGNEPQNFGTPLSESNGVVRNSYGE